MKTAAPRGRPGWLLAALAVFIVWGAVEGAAYLAYFAIDPDGFSPSRIARERAERRAVAGEAPAADVQPDDDWRPFEPQVVHPYQGYVYQPNEDAPLGSRARKSIWGFPDDAPPFRERSRGRFIIGILGGSLARDFAARAEDLLVPHLAAAPALAGRRFSIVRLAINGYKQPQQLATAAYLLSLGAEFDVLLNIDGFNEVALDSPHNARDGVYPAFPRAWATRVRSVPNPAARVALGKAAYLGMLRGAWATTFAATPLRYSVLASFVWRARDLRLGAAIEAARRDLELARGPAAHYVESGPPRPPGAEEYAELARVWRRASLQLDGLARANGIAYFHFLQPNQYVSGSKPMDESERAVALSERSPYRKGAEAGYPLLIREGAVLQAAGVHYRDLSAVFADIREAVYRDDCCHLNERGNELLAAAIAQVVLDEIQQ